MTFSTNYRGRFAPSPTGPLHFGSLVAAVGSYLDAKAHHGIWLVRLEDLDTPRCVPGAADDILMTLAAFGLISDEPVMYQSRRTAAYEQALAQLQEWGAAYPCCCTRREIADSALHGIDGPVYPGTCRNGIKRPSPLAPLMEPLAIRLGCPITPAKSLVIPPAGEGKQPARTPAWRVRTDSIPSPFPLPPSPVAFTDALQGHLKQRLETEVGDFVVKRADGLFAYQLAVVVDDAAQGITHVVRGADLLDSTPRQIHLQHLLDLNTPTYMHLPVAVNAAGEKLSKQTLAPAIGRTDAAATLVNVLEFLRQQPPAGLRRGTVAEVLEWAVAHWCADRLRGCRALPVSGG